MRNRRKTSANVACRTAPAVHLTRCTRVVRWRRMVQHSISASCPAFEPAESPAAQTALGCLCILAGIVGQLELFAVLTRRQWIPIVFSRKMAHIGSGSLMTSALVLFPRQYWPRPGGNRRKTRPAAPPTAAFFVCARSYPRLPRGSAVPRWPATPGSFPTQARAPGGLPLPRLLHACLRHG